MDEACMQRSAAQLSRQEIHLEPGAQTDNATAASDLNCVKTFLYKLKDTPPTDRRADKKIIW